jgi:hypothetical protein
MGARSQNGVTTMKHPEVMKRAERGLGMDRHRRGPGRLARVRPAHAVDWRVACAHRPQPH